MNLSETVFIAPQGDDFAIRWFTPIREVDLVGHATLAAGHLVLDRLRPGSRSVRFVSAAGDLIVSRDGAAYAMDMPALPPKEIAPPHGLFLALGRNGQAVLAAKHYLVVFDLPDEVAGLAPDMASLATLERPAVIVTAPGGGPGVDFVSRFFAPANGVPEDPVSGVAHCCLTPYWSRRLGKRNLVGRQLSRRGGTVRCEDRNDRVSLGGGAVIFLEGRIRV
jgi:predicted PhzF superfamily epimerase YddE/YHI9